MDDAGRLVLSKYSRLDGPYLMDAALCEQLGFPPGLTNAFVATTLAERGDPPFPGSLDPTGVARAFPDGLPIREEARAVDWLVAAARRLGGAVRLDPSGVVLIPRPDAATDLTVVTNLWLEPWETLELARSVSPAFELASDLHPWGGPASSGLPGEVSSALSDAQREALHAQADAVDARTLRGEPVISAYALRADFGQSGTGWIEASGGEAPLALQHLDWAGSGVVSYAVRWDPANEQDRLIEFPSAEVAGERAAAGALLGRLARAIHGAVGIEILDQDGFLVDPADI
jgi:hypothetical protein